MEFAFQMDRRYMDHNKQYDPYNYPYAYIAYNSIHDTVITLW